MATTPQPTRPAWEHRLQAVLALLGGEPVPEVTARFGMGRSILYSRWREIRACNDNTSGESKGQNYHDSLSDLTFLIAATDPKSSIY